MLHLDVQLSAAHVDWPTLRSASRRAESAGFSALWTFDHLAGVALGGDRMLECFSWLGALTECTTRIELGVLVANSWNRQAGALVAAAASIATMSERRFHLGIGAGTSPRSPWAREQHAVGAHLEPRMADRHARVEEVLDLTDRLWADERQGVDATFTRPVERPSRVLGVNSAPLSTLAGRRADGVNVRWTHPRRDEFLALARAEAADRPFSASAWVGWDPALCDPEHPLVQEAEQLGLERLVLLVDDPGQFDPPTLAATLDR